MKKNRIVKELNSSIHSILFVHDQVFLALNHRQLCVFQRDSSKIDLNDWTKEICVFFENERWSMGFG